MPLAIFLKLLGIFAIVGLGYVAGRRRWVAGHDYGGDASRFLSNAAFTLFMPALLFRTTARTDFDHLPWATLAVFFVPLFLLMAAVYALLRRHRGAQPAMPAVRTITVGFGNTVQLGIPIAAALFGDEGLAVHLAIVSLHALLILTFTTTLVEIELAHARSRAAGTSIGLPRMLAATLRNTLIHPVVLPVVAGIAWNLSGLPLPAALDEMLALLGQAAVPVCLVIIGLAFAHQGLAGLAAVARVAVTLSATKLVLLPAVVLVIGHWGFGLVGVPLAVIVLCAALPTGSNALIFAQRYDTLSHEVTVTTVLSTLVYGVTAPLWLLVLAAFDSA